MRIRMIAIIFILLFPNILLADTPKAPLFNNLGHFHHPISTQNLLSQRYFDQGLVLLYSFEYGEAIRSFHAAILEDKNCAMCYWGLALALGSKTDMPLDGHELADAKTMINLAMKKVNKQNLVERLYIAALAQRYTEMSPQKMDEFAGLCSGYVAVSNSSAEKYALAMKKVVAALPDDADAKTLYAAALFDVTGWNFWNEHGRPNPHTLDTINSLESAMKINNNHPGANHLYVHIIEGSPYPTKSLPNAERLHQLVPGSEHLAHMPCHTYYSVGDYHKGTIANQQAIEIYKKYVNSCKKSGFEPETQYLYYHNYDYMITTASMEGRKKFSISTADALFDLMTPLAEKNPALQKMLTNKILMRARFGEWQDILNIPKPSEQYQYVLGIWHYALGTAAVHVKQIDAANQHLKQLHSIIKQGPTTANLSNIGITLLKIADNILQAELADQKGEFYKSSNNFIQAIKIQDTLTSSDPPPWYFPVRQLYGVYLIKWKKFNDAKTVFTEDLKKNPHNGWSLYGLSEALRGLSKVQEAQYIDAQFKQAWRYADISPAILL